MVAIPHKICKSQHRWNSSFSCRYIVGNFTMIILSHVEGATRLIMILLGISKRMYGTKKMKRAIL